MVRLKRIAMLGIMIVATPVAFAQYRRAEDTETFRRKLTVFMDALSVMAPEQVRPEVIDSIATLDQRQLEMLQKAFPPDESFWRTPWVAASFLNKNSSHQFSLPTVPFGNGGVVTLSARPMTAQSLRPIANANIPVVTAFSISAGDFKEGSASFSILVSGTGTDLKQIELWRAQDNGLGTAPDPDTWVTVGRKNVSGNSVTNEAMSYSPSTFGTFWFGVHIVDGAAQYGVEPNPPGPFKRNVLIDLNKKCPAGFDYETLWITRDGLTFGEIAKELIPEDVTTAIPYSIAAVAWAGMRTVNYVVEQVYSRNGDCQNGLMAAKIDQTISSRASQSSVDGLATQTSVNTVQTSINNLNFSNLDAKVTTRATQTSVDNVKTDTGAIKTDTGDIKTALAGLNTGNLDAKITTRATQTSVDSIKTDTTNLDAKITTRATQTSVDSIKNDTTKLDVNVASRATQLSVDAVKTSVDGLNTSNLDAKITTRASQGSADAIMNKVNTLDTGKLDVPVSTRAEQLTLNNWGGTIMTKLNTLDTGKLDINVTTRASQASVDALSSTLTGQEALRIQIVEVERSKHYIAYVTRSGAPVAGVTVQLFRVLSLDKNKAVVAQAMTPAVTEVAPGIEDISFDLKGGVPTGYALTVSVGQGATAVIGSTIWSDHQVQY